MHIYQQPDDKPAWICGHWNSSPLAIGMGKRTTIGTEQSHHHPYCEYYIGLEGEAILEVENETITLRPQMVIMVEPGERHHIVAIDPSGARWIVIQERSIPHTKYIADSSTPI